MFILAIFTVAIAIAFFVAVLGMKSSEYRFTLPVLLLVMYIVEELTCLYADYQLGGMSGDIAGLTICMGELSGIITLAMMVSG
jgi:cobalamin synthase